MCSEECCWGLVIETEKPYLLDRYRPIAERCAERFRDLFGEEPPKLYILIQENPDLLHTHTHETPDGKRKETYTDTVTSYSSKDRNNVVGSLLKLASQGVTPFIYMDKAGPLEEQKERARFAFGHELGHWYARNTRYFVGNTWWDEAVATFIGGQELLRVTNPAHGFSLAPGETLDPDKKGILERGVGAFYAQSQNLFRYLIEKEGVGFVRKVASRRTIQNRFRAVRTAFAAVNPRILYRTFPTGMPGLDGP